MCVALLTLIGLQTHWVLKDFKAAERSFERNARFAITSAVDKFLELQILSKSHVIIGSDWATYDSDSISDKIIEYSITTDSLRFPPKFKVKTENVFLSSFEEENLESVYINKDSSKVSIIIEKSNESLKYERTLNGSSYSHVKDVSEIDYRMLDSLITNRFILQELPSNVHLGVFSSDVNELLYKNNKKLNRSDFRNAIKVPIDIIGGEGISLLITFPDKQGFLWQEVLLVVLTSSLLVIVVAVAFWLAIRNMLKQKKLSEIKNDFINNMTHEFKTPISNVGLAIEALKSFGMMAKPETTNKYLNIAQTENQRLGKQVEKVLQMALLEKEEFKLKIKSVNLHQVITDLSHSFKVQLEGSDGELLVDLSDDDVQLEADELHLTNVLFNLLDNANKYSAGSPSILIKTKTSTEGVTICIKDKGLGMAKEHVKHIFKKFYRVPTGNVHNSKGFGLGLSYVDQVIKKHGGVIAVESVLGEGTSFEIRLPYQQSV